jgi:peptidoglycan/LPS O-acetylase OafA/YrhL
MASSDRVNTQPERSSSKSVRLHYLDWLRVLATLGVFLYHTTRPFDLPDWMINNAGRSIAVTAVGMLVYLWGMPLFFLLAGAGSRFALRRRTGRQFVSERVKRLGVPFILGAILFNPFQEYFEWIHNGRVEGPFLTYYLTYGEPLSPKVFIKFGGHLWFVGFLFVFSLIVLPLFLWLKKDAGKRFVSWLAGLCERRGTILVVILPLALIRFILQPLFPEYADWTDLFFMLVFFVSGYILYADERFTRVIRRDGKLVLAAGIISMVAMYAIFIAGAGETWLASPGTPGFYLVLSVLSAVAWCWVIIMLYVGMRFLDFTSKWLEYGQEAMMPFYMFHHPVIVAIAFYVVQWQAGILAKILVIVPASFVVTIGLTEIIRCVRPVRALFGMKTARRAASVPSPAGE